MSGLLVFGIYLFSLGADSLITTVNYVVVSVAHALFGVGILTGLVADRGLVRMTSPRVIDGVALIVIIEARTASARSSGAARWARSTKARKFRSAAMPLSWSQSTLDVRPADVDVRDADATATNRTDSFTRRLARNVQ